MYIKDGLGIFGNFKAKYLYNNYICFKVTLNLIPGISSRLCEFSKELIKLLVILERDACFVEWNVHGFYLS